MQETVDIEKVASAWYGLTPIERKMMDALYSYSSVDQGLACRVFCRGVIIHDLPGKRLLQAGRAGVVTIRVQESIAPYRADFRVTRTDLEFSLESCLRASEYTAVHPPRSAIVERDGHDYHERTKEQARHDKQRDRFMQRQGHTVLRFTGSEIYADAHACAVEILSSLEPL